MFNEFKKGGGPAPNFARKTMATPSPRERSIRPRASHEFNRNSLKYKNEKLESLRQNWYGARIAILGFGREGIDTFKFLRKLFPEKILGVADRDKNSKLKTPRRRAPILCKQVRGTASTLRGGQNSKLLKKTSWHLGENYLKALKNYDVIIKSPGIPIHLPEIEKAFKEGKITSQTEIFLENCPGKVIGITGTKGKGTTSSLIYGILKEGGFKAHLVGNIEKPALSLLLKAKANDIFVYELSSHQLFNLKKSPQIAVFLNLFPAHLDYYKNFNEYIRAKANITSHQKKKDILIYNYEDKLVREIARKSKAQKIPFSSKIPFEFLASWKKSQMKGNFNLLNTMAAVAVGKILGVSKKDIARAIEKFKALPHRLEFVGKYKEIKFYDDSLATIPEATIGAIEALGKEVETIILGGYESYVDYKKLAKKVLESKIKTVILFPPSGCKIWKTLASQNKKMPKHFFVDKEMKKKFSSSSSPHYKAAQCMKDAIRLCYQYTKRGKICLLSCASPSYGIFKNYKERGSLFNQYVKKYAR